MHKKLQTIPKLKEQIRELSEFREKQLSSINESYQREEKETQTENKVF